MTAPDDNAGGLGGDTPPRGWRGSADLWLDAAYDLLIDGGVEAVRIMPMARRLGLSRTSFYWHFADRDALLNALVARWRDQNTGNLVLRTQAYAETITEAVLNLFDAWVAPTLFDARLEFAMRNWAQTAPDLATELARADARRLAAITAMFARHGFAPDQAETRARALYLTQIGYISMRASEALPERLARIPAYVQVFAGASPSTSEMARFEARHLASVANTGGPGL